MFKLLIRCLLKELEKSRESNVASVKVVCLHHNLILVHTNVSVQAKRNYE
jgi:hypothetical protein